MKERIRSSIVIIVILGILVFLSHIPYVINICVALLAAAALYEVLVATKYLESKVLISFCLLFALLIPLAGIFTQHGYTISFTLGLFLFTMVFFLLYLHYYKTFKIEHISFIFIMTFLIPFFFSTIIFVRQQEFGLWNMIMIFICAWTTDAGGYVFGRMFGRHKMTPVISPKKTIEGALGGMAASIACLTAFAYCIDLLCPETEVNYPLILLYGIFGAGCAILGDLTASLIKRNFGAKDFGNLIPGHGGIMDRFDSVWFVAPMIFLAMQFAPVFSAA